MGKRVRVREGYIGVLLGNGRVYSQGMLADLTDQQHAATPEASKDCLIWVANIPDPTTEDYTTGVIAQALAARGDVLAALQEMLTVRDDIEDDREEIADLVAHIDEEEGDDVASYVLLFENGLV